MPASLIFSAFGQVMQSFSDVSADYDKIMGFFEFTHRFFDRLSIIDQKMPATAPFQRCVSRVFSSILKLCAIAQRYSAEKRFSKLPTGCILATSPLVLIADASTRKMVR
jgi:hypothetical protein